MKGCVMVLVYFLGCCSALLAQDAWVLLRFEAAEKAFNTGAYQETLRQLDAVEKKTGVTSKTLYLRIVAEYQLFDNGARLYEEEGAFKRLQQLKQHTQQYLHALSGQPVDDQYREIYRIGENLQAFPKDRAGWLRGRKGDLAEKEKEALAREVEKQRARKRQQQHRADEEQTAYAAGRLPPEAIRYNSLSRLLAQPADSTCTVYFYRKPVLSGRLVHTKIFLHNQFVFPLATKHYQKIILSPGVAKFNGLHGTFSGSAKNMDSKIYKESTLCLRLKPGQTYYIDSRLQKFIVLKTVSEREAAAWIEAYEPMEDPVP